MGESTCSVCMNAQKWRKKETAELLTERVLSLAAAQDCSGQAACVHNPEKYPFFIHPSIQPSPLPIYPAWSQLTGVSPQLGMRESKGQLSIYVSHNSYFLLSPLRGFAIGTTSEDPPSPQSADSLWTCLMRNGTPILFAGDLKNVPAAASSSPED